MIDVYVQDGEVNLWDGYTTITIEMEELTPMINNLIKIEEEYYGRGTGTKGRNKERRGEESS